MTQQTDKGVSAPAEADHAEAGNSAAPLPSRQRWPARLYRRSLQLGVCLLVLFALYVTAGRVLMPLVAGQTAAVEAQLSRMLGARVSIGDLRGTWYHFGPGLDVSDLRVSPVTAVAQQESTPAGNSSDGQVHVVDHAFLSIDVLATLIRRQPVIERITIDGMRLALIQTDEGRWTLSGFTPGESSQNLLDFVLDTPDITFTGSALHLRTAAGAELVLDSLHLDLQNQDSQHELRTQFRINGQASPSQLLMSMSGDPRADYSASVYGTTRNLALAPLSTLLPAGTGEWALQNAEGSGDFWLSLDNDRVQNFVARVSDLQVRAAADSAGRSLDLNNAAFTLSMHPATRAAADSAVPAGWTVQISDAGFDLQQRPWRIRRLQLDVPVAASAPVTVRAESVELAMLSQMTVSLLALPPATTSILGTLDPRGYLQYLQLQTARDGSYPGGFLLRANLLDGAVNAWNAAPSGSGLQGYVQIDAGGGFAEIDSRDLTIHLPRLFTEAWHYDYLNTRVEWAYGDGFLRVGSTPIAVRNSSLDGQVQFELRNSRGDQGQTLSQFSLLVGMQSMDVAMGHAYLPTLGTVRETMTWLDTALDGGTLRDSGFILRTASLDGATIGSNTLATWYDVSGGRLQFLPDWPLLEDIEAQVDVRDGRVDVSAEAASIAGIALRPTRAMVRAGAASGTLLTVQGNATANTAEGLDFLRNTPVKQAIGPLLDDWQASGELDIDIALDIPLGASAEMPDIAIDVLSTGSELLIPEYALAIRNINGRIAYHSDTGLAASALNANLFDYPIVADITTIIEPAAGPVASVERTALEAAAVENAGIRTTTRINSTGRTSIAALQAWPAQPPFVRRMLGYLDGEIDYTAQLDISNRNDADELRTRLSLSSNLQGVASRFPQPFKKASEDIAPLELSMAFLDGGQILTTRYDDFLSGEIVLSGSGIERGQLYFGDRNRNFTVRQADQNAPGLLVNGDVPRFDYEQWRQVADVLGGGAQAGGDAQPLADYLRLVDINLGTLAVLGQELRDINVQVEHDAGSWQLSAYNPLLSGSFQLPDDATLPWLINLDYLRFPPREMPKAGQAAEDTEPVDVLAGVDPAGLPAFDFRTAELSIGEQNLGEYSFEFRPHSSGASIANFRMQAEDASITDIAGTGGANIDWRTQGGRHYSSFNGLFAAGNLATVLPTFGHDANIESASARFSGTLQWQGSPLAFSPSTSSGQIVMDINDGRFVNIESGSSRLMGALNFDSLIRRLQLDFSDLFQRGFAFDKISGNLDFDEGMITTNGGIIIDGPSSRININGQIDLAAETIAADMQVRIPLGQNISMLAGLLGAWPIAVSTYIASKIFQEQVEDFATIIYRLEGPWASPDAGFEVPEGAQAAAPAQAGENEVQ